jgi:hypothetical protein
MRAALFRGSNLDVARVMGVFDSAVRVPRAKPLLGRPAVKGIASGHADYLKMGGDRERRRE